MNEDNLDPRFEDTVFVVEATSYELFTLWQQHSYQGSLNSALVPDQKRYEWKQDCFSKIVEIGRIDDKPITIIFSWYTINGHRIVFYERCSWYIDLYQVEAWLLINCNPVCNGNRRAHCDAMNFSHCLRAIDDLNRKLTKPELIFIEKEAKKFQKTFDWDCDVLARQIVDSAFRADLDIRFKQHLVEQMFTKITSHDNV